MKSLAIAALMLLSLSGWAQDNDNESSTNPFVNELGFNAGFTTGLGLSYRHWFDKFGLQLTSVPFKYYDYALISVGVTPMYSMYNSRYIRIYTYWGNHVCYRSWPYTEYLYNEPTKSYITSTEYNVGLGFGFSFGRVVAFNISLGYGAYDVLGGFDNLSLLPTCEMGLFWRF